MFLKAIIIIAVIAVLAHGSMTNFETYRSRVDDQEYKVLADYSDAQEAADILSEINKKNRDLIRFMQQKYAAGECHSTEADCRRGRDLAAKMHKRYQPDRLEENNPVDKNNTSYTENKGDKVALCLREKQSGANSLHDMNIIEFVDLHEMAHIASEGYGHEDEFWDNFSYILKNAKEARIHEPVDYAANPINYCGLDVKYSPFYS
jgi:predicted metal-dependent hydrolase